MLVGAVVFAVSSGVLAVDESFVPTGSVLVVDEEVFVLVSDVAGF